MTDSRERGGFWGHIFRTKSSATKGEKLRRGSRRASEGDVSSPVNVSHRRRASATPSRGEVALDSNRRRPRRLRPEEAKGKGLEYPNGARREQGPLTEWPPSGMSSEEELTLGHAMQLVATGAPAFKGHKRPIPHASDHYYALYATVAGNRGGETDGADHHDTMIQLMTLRLQGAGPARDAWETLEQPSYSVCFGRRPGTVTLNHWVSMASLFPPPIALRDPGVDPRDIELDEVMERLQEMERSGIEDDDNDVLYKTLYRRLLRDPDKHRKPHRTLDKQITDLIMVLSRPDWIDFTNPRNQIPTRFIFDTSPGRHSTYLKFFHQLLLSVELDARIHSKHHLPEAKEQLLRQIPPTIQWNLALARRWRDNVRVEAYGDTADQVRLRYKLKKRQVKMLKRFAQMMKWPNLDATLDMLKQRDLASTLDLVSSHAMAFFSGLVLPGPTFPFLMMNSLIDIDPDKATDELALLTHLHPSCGFQYRNSYTYWTAESVIGKVLAPTCHAVAGWVGPARPTVDLGRSQIARIRSRKPRQQPTAEDVKSMLERSDALGPPTDIYPVREYALVAPDLDDDDDDALHLVRTELLTLKPCTDRPADESGGPRWFDASLQFAVDGVSWPLRLTFNVSFISSWPCSDGPHPLFFDYTYQVVKADELVHIRDWNGQYGGHPNDRSATSTPLAAAGGSSSRYNGREAAADRPVSADDEERVLVVEAFGVADNEVLARAWCSHWGLSAVVADINTTCMACAIRNAFAATVTVLILVDESQQERDD